MATVQRVYSQPSCTLQVSGIATGGDVLSVLTEFRVRFQDYPQIIVAGADVLRQLSHVISLYSQSLQKNLPLTNFEVNGIKLQSVGQYSHILTVPTSLVDVPTGVALQPSGTETERGAAGVKAEFNLSTVQLFDLMDVIDQMVVDPTTLPDLQLDFDVAAHRPQSPLGAKLLPALVGVVGLAATAGVLYMLPVPKNQPRPVQTVPANSVPVPPKPKTKPPVPSPTSSPVPSASPSDSKPEPTSSGTSSPSNTSGNPINEPSGGSTSPVTDSKPTTTPNSSAPQGNP